MEKRSWRDLADAQESLVSFRQLRELETSPDFVRHKLESGRWVRRTSLVLSTTTGPLAPEQREWCAVLHGGDGAMLGGLSAAARHGLRNWGREDVTVLVPNQDSFEPVPGVAFVRSRRILPEWLSTDSPVPLARIEPAVLLFAAYERSWRTAQGSIAAVVQQRLATVESFADWLQRMKPLRRAPRFRGLLADLSGGAQSLAEVDLRRACREFGLALPRSQRSRRDRNGKRRFTDAEWVLPDGRVLVLEVDGAFHDDVLEAAEHRARNRKLTSLDRIVIQCSAIELRDEPWAVMEDLIALGVPRSG